jgi:hypothetical protein
MPGRGSRFVSATTLHPSVLVLDDVDGEVDASLELPTPPVRPRHLAA